MSKVSAHHNTFDDGRANSASDLFVLPKRFRYMHASLCTRQKGLLGEQPVHIEEKKHCTMKRQRSIKEAIEGKLNGN